MSDTTHRDVLEKMLEADQHTVDALNVWPELKVEARKRIFAITAALEALGRDGTRGETKSCETCQFADDGPDLTERICCLPSLRYLNDGEGLGYETRVPTTINGQPFGCRGHQPRVSADGMMY